MTEKAEETGETPAQLQIQNEGMNKPLLTQFDIKDSSPLTSQEATPASTAEKMSEIKKRMWEEKRAGHSPLPRKPYERGRGRDYLPVGAVRCKGCRQLIADPESYAVHAMFCCGLLRLRGINPDRRCEL